MAFLKLLKSPCFAPLFATAVLDAFNDNLFKTALLMLASYGLYRAEPARAELLAAIAGGVFVAPFFLFSALAGQVADIVDRARVVRWVKGAEVAIMALGLAGFTLQSIPLLLGVLFLAGAHSAFYSPLKYAILPQHLAGPERLTATGLMEAGGFVAILGGQLLAGVVAPWVAGVATCVLACAGLGASLLIPPARPSGPPAPLRLNVLGESLRLVRRAAQIRPVWLCILANAWFYVVGAVLLGEIVPLAQGSLHVRREVTALFMGLFSVGVASGALIVGRLLGGRVSARFVPASALGLGLLLFDLSLALWSYRAPHAETTATAFLATAGAWRIVGDLAGAAVCGGVFVVPLLAILQAHSPDAERARILAANNIVNAGATASAMAVAAGLLALHVPLVALIGLLGAGTLGVALFARPLMRNDASALAGPVYRPRQISAASASSGPSGSCCGSGGT